MPFDFDSVSKSGYILHMYACSSVHVTTIATISKGAWIGNGLIYRHLSTFRLTIYSQGYYTCWRTLRVQNYDGNGYMVRVAISISLQSKHFGFIRSPHLVGTLDSISFLFLLFEI